ncbi:MAG: hypothetical protein V1645_03820 [archaeon]
MGRTLLFLGIVLLFAFSVSAAVTTYDGYGFERAGRSIDRDIDCYFRESRLICPFTYDDYVVYKPVYRYDGYRRYYYPDYSYRSYRSTYNHYNNGYYNAELDVFHRYLRNRIDSSYRYSPSYSSSDYDWDGKSSYN